MSHRFRSGIPGLLRQDGERIVILLRGGTKKRQQDDIELAAECWQDYKKQRRSEQWR